MERTRREASHLADFIAGKLDQAGISATYVEERESDEEPGRYRFAYEYTLSGVYKRQRRPAQLLLCFDLARPGPATSWSPGQTAILLVAYDHLAEEGWVMDHLSFGTDGLFLDEHAAPELKTIPGSGGRLLAWGESVEEEWNRGASIFAIQLSKLSDLDVADREIIQPILALLRNSPGAFSSLTKSNLVAWPGGSLAVSMT